MHQLTRTVLVLVTLLCTQMAEGYNMFLNQNEDYNNLSDAQKEALEANRPQITFPESF